MIKINENLLKNSGRKYPPSNYHIVGTYELTRPIVQGERVTMTVYGQLAPEKSVWMVQNESGKIVTAFNHNDYDADIGAYVSWESARADATQLRLYANYIGEIGVSHVDRVKLELGSEPTMWIPAEADLTPEQVAFLPPYGEYTVINSF